MTRISSVSGDLENGREENATVQQKATNMQGWGAVSCKPFSTRSHSSPKITLWHFMSQSSSGYLWCKLQKTLSCPFENFSWNTNSFIVATMALGWTSNSVSFQQFHVEADARTRDSVIAGVLVTVILVLASTHTKTPLLAVSCVDGTWTHLVLQLHLLLQKRRVGRAPLPAPRRQSPKPRGTRPPRRTSCCWCSPRSEKRPCR